MQDAGEEMKRGITSLPLEQMHRFDLDIALGHDLAHIILLGLGFATNPADCHP
jgi:hypothetical protein